MRNSPLPAHQTTNFSLVYPAPLFSTASAGPGEEGEEELFSEIRPAVLQEPSTLGRLQIVRRAFELSIEHLDGERDF